MTTTAYTDGACLGNPGPGGWAYAVSEGRCRSGAGRPENRGPPDRAGDITAPGRRIAVFGSRPPELGGWGGGPLADAVRDKVADIVTAKARLHGNVVLVTGLNLGVEQMAAEMGLPYVAVLPFPGQEEPWPAAGKSRYRDLLGRAAQVVEAGHEKPADREAFGKAFGRRDDQILKM